ncbi:MAG TPA: DUF423 domain-containing protein [Actinomycetota bacterium]|nr:DUF423 domain-containing protein [Actinomycetota bacterium]
MERTFLVLGAAFGFVGVLLGAFGSHALRSRLTPERVATFETGVRYQLWHALALFAVVFVGSLRFVSPKTSTAYVLIEGSIQWPAWSAGWLFVVGVVLFSGSLYMLALTGRRTWGAFTPVGGVFLVLGWLALALEAWVA